MTNKQVFRGALTALAGILLCTVSPSFLAAQEANVAVYAAMNHVLAVRGDVHVVDAARDRDGLDLFKRRRCQ